MIIGSKIKQLRKIMHLTQKDLAKLLGLSTSTVQKYELEQREPTIETLSKMSEIFGVSLDTFTKKYLPPKDFLDMLDEKLDAHKKELMSNKDSSSDRNDNKASKAISMDSYELTPQQIYYWNRKDKNMSFKGYLFSDVNYINYIIDNYSLDCSGDSDTKYILSNVFDIDLGFLTDEQALDVKSAIIFTIKLKLEEFKNKAELKREGE